MKREDQQDAAIRCLLLTSVSTCFGHHYAHLQENKGPVTAFGVLFWFCCMWLVAVVRRCLAGCDHMLQDSAPQRYKVLQNCAKLHCIMSKQKIKLIKVLCDICHIKKYYLLRFYAIHYLECLLIFFQRLGTFLPDYTE